MSLVNLAASPKTDVIEGKTLHPLTLIQIGQLQNHFECRHLQKAAMSTGDMPDDLAEKMLNSAQLFIVNGNLHYGTKAFDMNVCAFENLPYLLYLALLTGDSKMTPSNAAKLITDDNRSKIQRACLECLGWSFPKNEEPAVAAPIAETPVIA